MTHQKWDMLENCFQKNVWGFFFPLRKTSGVPRNSSVFPECIHLFWVRLTSFTCLPFNFNDKTLKVAVKVLFGKQPCVNNWDVPAKEVEYQTPLEPLCFKQEELDLWCPFAVPTGAWCSSLVAQRICGSEPPWSALAFNCTPQVL